MTGRKPACPSGKLRYPDRGAARRALAHVQRKDRQHDRRERTTYRCPHCHGWHLSSHAPQPKPRGPRR